MLVRVSFNVSSGDKDRTVYVKDWNPTSGATGNGNEISSDSQHVTFTDSPGDAVMLSFQETADVSGFLHRRDIQCQTEVLDNQPQDRCHAMY